MKTLLIAVTSIIALAFTSCSCGTEIAEPIGKGLQTPSYISSGK